MASNTFTRRAFLNLIDHMQNEMAGRGRGQAISKTSIFEQKGYELKSLRYYTVEC